jgi:hypothetical protein
MSHLSMDDLLAVRDGAVDETVQAHVAACTACIAEVERLRALRAELRELPEERPGRDLWPVVVARMERRRRIVRGATLAAAAVLALAVGLAAGIARRGPAAVAADPELVALVTESQRLEHVLRQLEGEPRVISFAEAGALLELADRVAGVDARLATAEPAQARVLWGDRVELLDTMVGVRATRDAYVGF